MKPLIIVGCFFMLCGAAVHADCALDHFTIGVNEDGVAGTGDDNRLFVDCEHKYRHSGSEGYANWFYPLAESIFADHKWRIGEPGFDVFQRTDPAEHHTYDPNRCPGGAPDDEYRIMVECVAISGGLRAVHKDFPQFTIDAAGQSFNHSAIHKMRGEGHMHMSYQAVDGASLFWVTWRLVDVLEDSEQYEPSRPFTIVFNQQPMAGDLVVDGIIDGVDLAAFADYWLRGDASRANDYCERADASRDGRVNLADFAALAANWLILWE